MDFPRIIFYGTPEFASASLEKLISGNFNVVGVVTAPDKPAGRGLKIQHSSVKSLALQSALPVFQPLNLKDPSFIHDLEILKPDIQVVVAFRMLPRVVWALPPNGTFNLHASLLPQYRGAAPIQWAIINGERETGVTTFFIDDSIDTGMIILQQRVPIGCNETGGELCNKLMKTGAELVVETIRRIQSGDYRKIPQNQSVTDGVPMRVAPKISKEVTCIDWTKDVISIVNLIRGLDPIPGAYTDLRFPNGSVQSLKLFKSSCELSAITHKPGELILVEGTKFKIAGSDGFVLPEEVQLAGKRRMLVREFMNGSGRFLFQKPW